MGTSLARAELAADKGQAGLAQARFARWPGQPKMRAAVARLLADMK